MGDKRQCDRWLGEVAGKQRRCRKTAVVRISASVISMGEESYYCGEHAKAWRKEAPDRVTELKS